MDPPTSDTTSLHSTIVHALRAHHILDSEYKAENRTGFFDLPRELRDEIYDYAFTQTTRLRYDPSKLKIHEVRPIGHAFLISRRFTEEYNQRIPTFSRLAAEKEDYARLEEKLPARARLASTLEFRQFCKYLAQPQSVVTDWEPLCDYFHRMNRALWELSESMERLDNVELVFNMSCKDLQPQGHRDFLGESQFCWWRECEEIGVDQRLRKVTVTCATEGTVLFSWQRDTVGYLEDKPCPYHKERCIRSKFFT